MAIIWDERLVSRVKRSRLGPVIKRTMSLVGYENGQWLRTVMYRECMALVTELGPQNLDALEISAGDKWQTLNFRSFTETQYPAFDVCVHRLDRSFDIIIADQVFEHLLWPHRAARNVHSMLRPGGYFLVTTPFLVRLHDGIDCTRWSALGMRYFLAECGFPLETIRTSQWGNRSCVKANFNHWARRGWFGSLRNEANFPVVVWALAQRGPARAEEHRGSGGAPAG
jgi:SAM-dependent methyltransferase